MSSAASWGVDQCSMLKIYCALICSKLNYGSMVYGSARSSALKVLDPIHHQGLRLCTGAFCTSPVQSLYMESHEPTLHLCRLQLSLLYFSKLHSLPKHPTWGCVFLPWWAILFHNRRSAIAPFGLHIQAQLDELGLSLDNIAESTGQPIPPWFITVPKCDLSLSHLRKTYSQLEEPSFIY
ncbi:uncharacterized protein LOC143239218 [Tachypleus tridentatus]|uniref:uncharacterized protein LOC143239218 n=1 Tax=Tachypleus tridentatus TaxID=6853 RepID=UPI003FD69856